MASTQQQIVRIRAQFVACNGTNELWADLSTFVSSIAVTKVRGRIVVCERGGNFRCRVGIQTYSADSEAPDTPIAITGVSTTGCGQLSAVGKNFVDFDPTLANNGTIGGKAGFRLGLWYSSTDATISRGDVIVELYIDA
jgi:hypothetical protein